MSRFKIISYPQGHLLKEELLDVEDGLMPPETYRHLASRRIPGSWRKRVGYWLITTERTSRSVSETEAAMILFEAEAMGQE